MIDIDMHTQPDDETCGPTSLHAIYRFYGDTVNLTDVISSVERSLSGGTLASLLGKHALERGFQVSMYANNLAIFDPTWFEDGNSNSEILIEKLTEQIKHKPDARLIQASNSYIQYLQMGGKILFKTISLSLLKDYFAQNIPIITGLSATYLYRCAREGFTEDGQAFYDDVGGTPCGHFVVLCGYDDHQRLVVVADPHRANPLSQNNYYRVSAQRLINAIMLGVLTFDANLLIIHPKQEMECKRLS